MADEPQKPELPKIKLSAPGSGEAPPRIKIKPADKKSETARIELSSAVPPAGKSESYKELTKDELDRYYEEHAGELLTPLKVRVAQMVLPNFPAAKDLETQVNRGGDFGKFAHS